MAADNRTLGRFRLEGIRPAPRGRAQVDVTYDIDANGILNVTAKDTDTGVEQRITISDNTNLPSEDIERMVADAERNRAEDIRLRENADARNQLDTIVYQVERRLAELGGRVATHESARAEQLIADARRALAENADVDRARPIINDLQQILYGLPAAGERETASAPGGTSSSAGGAGAAGAAGGAGGGGAGGVGAGGGQGAGGDDVIDAEFTTGDDG